MYLCTFNYFVVIMNDLYLLKSFVYMLIVMPQLYFLVWDVTIDVWIQFLFEWLSCLSHPSFQSFVKFPTATTCSSRIICQVMQRARSMSDLDCQVMRDNEHEWSWLLCGWLPPVWAFVDSRRLPEPLLWQGKFSISGLFKQKSMSCLMQSKRTDWGIFEKKSTSSISDLIKKIPSLTPTR
jgi:hypothetical protein